MGGRVEAKSVWALHCCGEWYGILIFTDLNFIFNIIVCKMQLLRNYQELNPLPSNNTLQGAGFGMLLLNCLRRTWLTSSARACRFSYLPIKFCWFGVSELLNSGKCEFIYPCMLPLESCKTLLNFWEKFSFPGIYFTQQFISKELCLFQAWATHEIKNRTKLLANR